MVGSASDRRNLSTIGIAVLVAFSAVIGAGILSMGYFMDNFGRCKTAVRNSIPSPNGHESIIIFEKECGATVGFNTQASIAPASRSFSAEVNPPFFVISGRPEFVASWLGDDVVEVTLVKSEEKIFKSEQSVGGIKVKYK